MLFGFILAGLISWFVLAPLLASGNHNGGYAGNGESQSLQEQKERCLQVLKDLELDFSTAKVSSEDYERTRTNLQVELAAILKKLDRLC